MKGIVHIKSFRFVLRKEPGLVSVENGLLQYRLGRFEAGTRAVCPLIQTSVRRNAFFRILNRGIRLLIVRMAPFSQSILRRLGAQLIIR